MEDLIRSETKTDSLMAVYCTNLKNNCLVHVHNKTFLHHVGHKRGVWDFQVMEEKSCVSLLIGPHAWNCG